MKNITICPVDWTNTSEFIHFNECGISTKLDTGFKLLSVSLSFIIFITELIVLILRRHHFLKKNTIAKVLILSSLIINPILSLRPLIGAFTPLRAVNNIGISIYTNFSAAMIANIAILFVFFEVNLLHKGSLKSDNKIYSLRKIYLGSLAVLQTTLYIGGSILSNYISNISKSQVFWFATAITDTALIPYLCIFGLILYYNINKMEQNKYKNLSKQILIIIISCSLLGSFTDIVSLTLFFLNGTYAIEWIFLELCWISAIIFCSCIFIILMKKSTKDVITSSTKSKSISNITNSNNSKI